MFEGECMVGMMVTVMIEKDTKRDICSEGKIEKFIVD